LCVENNTEANKEEHIPVKYPDPNNLGHDEDWEGNNAAFTCPHCGEVFIVSGTRVHNGERSCPECGK